MDSNKEVAAEVTEMAVLHGLSALSSLQWWNTLLTPSLAPTRLTESPNA